MTKRFWAFRILAFLPPVFLIAAIANSVSCGKSIFPAASSSKTATATATAGSADFLFVTNFRDGKISEFTRNTTTGKLTRVGAVPAGSSKGPEGMAIPTNNNFLYAANFKDGNIRQYSIGSGAVLTPLNPATVSNGSGSGSQIIAIDNTDGFLYVTNGGNGTVSAWTIGSDGTLTTISTTAAIGLQNPFGIAVDATRNLLYVADNQTGLLYSYTITSGGTLSLQAGFPVETLGPLSSGGAPGLMVIDSTDTYLYIDDMNQGVVSVFNLSSGSPVFQTQTVGNPTTAMPIGIDIAELSQATFVVTANQNAGTVWAFQQQAGGSLNPPDSFGKVSQPTTLVVDPLNQFMYTADQGDSTVGIFQFNVACPTTVLTVCQIGTIKSESNPPSGGSGPFGIVMTN